MSNISEVLIGSAAIVTESERKLGGNDDEALQTRIEGGDIRAAHKFMNTLNSKLRRDRQRKKLEKLRKQIAVLRHAKVKKRMRAYKHLIKTSALRIHKTSVPRNIAPVNEEGREPFIKLTGTSAVAGTESEHSECAHVCDIISDEKKLDCLDPATKHQVAAI